MNRSSVTVLLVDDVPEVRKVLARILERTGRYMLAEAESAREAMMIVADDPPDAMILDISMPWRSGLTVIPEVRAAAPSTKIVVLSSHYAMEAEVLAMGADAFLAKNAPPKKILATIAAVLAG